LTNPDTSNTTGVSDNPELPARHSGSKSSAPDSVEKPGAPGGIPNPDSDPGAQENPFVVPFSTTPKKSRTPYPAVGTPDKPVGTTPASPETADNPNTQEKALAPGSHLDP